VNQSAVPGKPGFALDLYAKLRAPIGNLFLSPYSISTALAMTYGGARGEAEKQMARAMHFELPQDRLRPAFAELETSLAAVQKKGKVKRCVANSFWPKKCDAFLPDYLDFCNKSPSQTRMDRRHPQAPPRVS
jgi:serine protease inhibitor